MFGRTQRNFFIFSLTISLVAFLMEAAYGEEPKGSKDDPKSPQAAQVMNLDETVVEGKIQKPEAFYLLEDAGLEHDEKSKKQNYLSEIVKAAKNLKGATTAEGVVSK